MCQHGCDEEAEDRHDKHEQQQRNRVVRCCHGRLHPKGGVEPCLARQPAQQRKPGQADAEHRRHTLVHVLELEVPQLVRQHGFNFAG